MRTSVHNAAGHRVPHDRSPGTRTATAVVPPPPPPKPGVTPLAPPGSSTVPVTGPLHGDQRLREENPAVGPAIAA
ncbi:hypothetical protein [Streptomyces sp. NPDC059247]|uniref:hypothetical protein n=1 Tax=Streptomyces sp. NPDC059247 TaxID=3346790 RepID=UPI0036C4B408